MPLPIALDTGGALNIYSSLPHAFDAGNRALAGSFAAHAGLAVVHAHRYTDLARQAEQMAAALRSRAVIEQAKGMVMAVQQCTATEAFNRLVSQSQREQRKLRDVAAAIIASVSGHPPELDVG